MSENCDKPNIVPPSNTAKTVKTNKPQTKQTKKTSKTSLVRGGVIQPQPSTTQPVDSQFDGAGNNTGGGTGGVAGGGGGTSSATGGRIPNRTPTTNQTQSATPPETTTETQQTPAQSAKQWQQPLTEHGKIKGEDVPEKDLCKGQEKRSEEFKPVSIYPFNKISQTESGHLTEIDDTPGSERVTFFHRAGSNYEYFPNGDVLNQHVRDSYFHVFRDQYVHLGGYSSVTIDKGLRILVNDDEEENKEGEHVNFDIHVAGNSNVNLYIHKGNLNVSLVEGDINMRVNQGDVNILQDSGNYNHTVGGDYNLEVRGHMHTVVGGNVIHEIGGNRDERIDGEFDQKHLTNTNSYLGEYVQGDKRSFVGKNQITEVAEQISEIAKNKIEQLQTKETSVVGLYAIKTDTNFQLFSRKNLSIQSLDLMLLRTDGNLDIFAAEDPKKRGKFKIYSANTLEVVSENYGVLRSANEIIEIKAPIDIKTITRVLYLAEKTDTAPGFSPDPRPINGIYPSKYSPRTAPETNNYIKSNKKEWLSTNSKK